MKNDVEKEEREELVIDLDTVKKAIETCLAFEKQKRITLIHPKGRKRFSEIYQREEPKRKIESIIDNKVKKELEPLNKKIDILLQLIAEGKIEGKKDEFEVIKEKENL